MEMAATDMPATVILAMDTPAMAILATEMAAEGNTARALERVARH
jgi:hypothetical protein